MAYCTIDDIKADFRKIEFNASSALTEPEVVKFIDEESAYIDARLSGRYQTPITGANALLVLRKICVFLVSCRVRAVLEIKVNARVKSEFKDNKCVTDRNPEKLLNDIAMGKIPLNDATLLSSEDGISSFNVDNNIEPYFSTTKQQW